MAWARLGTVYDLDLGNTSSGSRSDVTVPAGAKKVIVTVHSQDDDPEPLESVTAVSVAGVSLAIANDGVNDARVEQTAGTTEKFTELWHADIGAAQEGSGKTWSVTLTGATTGGKTRAALVFYDQTGDVTDVISAVSNGTATSLGAASYTTPALMIMAITAHSNMSGGGYGTGQTAYWDTYRESGVNTSPSVCTEEFYSAGGSDTPSSTWGGTRQTAELAVTFEETTAALPAPPVPTGVTCSATAEDQLTIDWAHSESPTNVSSFMGRYSIDEGASWFALGVIAGPGGRQAIHTGLDNQEQYRYQIAAIGDGINFDGVSAWSDASADCTPLPVPQEGISFREVPMLIFDTRIVRMEIAE